MTNQKFPKKQIYKNKIWKKLFNKKKTHTDQQSVWPKFVWSFFKKNVIFFVGEEEEEPQQHKKWRKMKERRKTIAAWKVEEEEESQGTTMNMNDDRKKKHRRKRKTNKKPRMKRKTKGRRNKKRKKKVVGRGKRRMCVPYGWNCSFIYIRVKDIFAISPYMLGASAKMLGAPSNTLKTIVYISRKALDKCTSQFAKLTPSY